MYSSPILLFVMSNLALLFGMEWASHHLFVLCLIMLLLLLFYHYIGDSGEGRGIQHLCTMIKNEIPGIYVLNLMIGSSTAMVRF